MSYFFCAYVPNQNVAIIAGDGSETVVMGKGQ